MILALKIFGWVLTGSLVVYTIVWAVRQLIDERRYRAGSPERVRKMVEQMVGRPVTHEEMHAWSVQQKKEK